MQSTPSVVLQAGVSVQSTPSATHKKKTKKNKRSHKPKHKRRIVLTEDSLDSLGTLGILEQVQSLQSLQPKPLSKACIICFQDCFADESLGCGDREERIACVDCFTHYIKTTLKDAEHGEFKLEPQGLPCILKGTKLDPLCSCQTWYTPETFLLSCKRLLVDPVVSSVSSVSECLQVFSEKRFQSILIQQTLQETLEPNEVIIKCPQQECLSVWRVQRTSLHGVPLALHCPTCQVMFCTGCKTTITLLRSHCKSCDSKDSTDSKDSGASDSPQCSQQAACENCIRKTHKMCKSNIHKAYQPTLDVWKDCRKCNCTLESLPFVPPGSSLSLSEPLGTLWTLGASSRDPSTDLLTIPEAPMVPTVQPPFQDAKWDQLSLEQQEELVKRAKLVVQDFLSGLRCPKCGLQSVKDDQCTHITCIGSREYQVRGCRTVWCFSCSGVLAKTGKEYADLLNLHRSNPRVHPRPAFMWNEQYQREPNENDAFCEPSWHNRECFNDGSQNEAIGKRIYNPGLQVEEIIHPNKYWKDHYTFDDDHDPKAHFCPFTFHLTGKVFKLNGKSMFSAIWSHIRLQEEMEIAYTTEGISSGQPWTSTRRESHYVNAYLASLAAYKISAIVRMWNRPTPPTPPTPPTLPHRLRYTPRSSRKRASAASAASGTSSSSSSGPAASSGVPETIDLTSEPVEHGEPMGPRMGTINIMDAVRAFGASGASSYSSSSSSSSFSTSGPLNDSKDSKDSYENTLATIDRFLGVIYQAFGVDLHEESMRYRIDSEIRIQNNTARFTDFNYPNFVHFVVTFAMYLSS